jgi:hypothetical protein
LHVVHAACHVDEVDRVDEGAGEGDVGPQVRDEVEPHAENAPRLVERHLGAVRDVARLLVGQEDLRARADPFHRAAELLGGDQHGTVLGIGVEAHAEAAAHLLGDDADLLRRGAEHCRDLPAHRRDALRARIEPVLVRGAVVDAQAGARLHGIAHHPGVVGA